MVLLADLITDLGSVVTLVVSTMTSFLELFCQPPLVIFVGLGVAGTAFMFVRKVLHR